MREIKFEICTQNKDGTDKSVEIYTLDELLRGYLPSNADVVYKRQYTNIKTGNGIELYDGDIIEYISFKVSTLTGKKIPNSESTTRKIIEWSTENFVNGWQLRTIDTTELNLLTTEKFGIGNISHTSLHLFLKNAKIIGNIYENPELLKQQL